jgi:pseudo-rSAM protein
MGKKYWFYIDTHVHLFLKKDSLLLYNSYTGKTLEYKGNADIIKLAKRLRAPRNLQVILLNESHLDQPAIGGFVSDIRKNFMGDLIDVDYSNGKPILMTPSVKNQMDVKFLKGEKDRSVGEDIKSYLTEISLYINENCNQGCSICRKAYKQFLCCTSRENGKNELKMGYINRLFSEIQHSNLSRVNILGGDFFAYSNLNDLISMLRALDCEKTYYLHYLNLLEHKLKLKLIADGDSLLTIIVNFPLYEEKLHEALIAVHHSEVQERVMFIIHDTGDFESSESIAMKYGIENVSYIPFFNGNNLPFFEENLFITREELECDRISSKEIYARSSVNPLNFGRLAVFTGCQVYANVNDPVLGNIGRDSIHNILSKELVKGKSWRKIRRHVKPCKSCIYSNLCPPISNYNIVTKRYNFCKVWKTI